MSDTASQSSGVASRYAMAVFELSKEAGEIDALEGDIASLDAAISESADFRDLIHSPIQCALPDMSPRVDWRKPLAAETRRQFLGEVAESRQLVLANHFPLPSVGRIEKQGEAFRWELLE